GRTLPGVVKGRGVTPEDGPDPPRHRQGRLGRRRPDARTPALGGRGGHEMRAGREASTAEERAAAAGREASSAEERAAAAGREASSAEERAAAAVREASSAEERAAAAGRRPAEARRAAEARGGSGPVPAPEREDAR